MKYPRLLFVYISTILMVTHTAMADECTVDQSQLQQLQKQMVNNSIDESKVSHLSPPCFNKLITTLLGLPHVSDQLHSQILALISVYCNQQNTFPAKLLKILTEQSKFIQSQKNKTTILNLWNKYNGTLDQAIERLKKNGDISQADSTYESLALLQKLSGNDLIQWSRIKIVRGDNRGAMKLLSHVCMIDSYWETLAHSECQAMLNEINSRDIQLQTLNLLTESIIQVNPHPSSHTIDWLSQLYNRQKLYDEQINLIVSHEPNQLVRSQRLIVMAQTFITSKQYVIAIKSLTAVLPFVTNDLNTHVSQLLFESYAALGIADSALLWYDRSNLKDVSNQFIAITLFQKTHQMTKAEKLLNALPASFEKDTLFMRHYLLLGAFENAKKIQNTLKLTHSSVETIQLQSLFWALRIALFSSQNDSAVLFLDSISALQPKSEWCYLPEFLQYQLHFQRLYRYPDALRVASALFFDTYRDTVTIKLNSLNINNLPKHSQEFLSSSIADLLISQSRYTQAKKILSLHSDTNPSSHKLYLMGKLYQQQQILDSAYYFFDKAVIAEPHSVYSHMARTRKEQIKQNPH